MKFQCDQCKSILTSGAVTDGATVTCPVCGAEIVCRPYCENSIIRCILRFIPLKTSKSQKSQAKEGTKEMDPKDHSGQNKVFDWAAKRFKEEREMLYWELHEKTGYSLGRPYNPKLRNRELRQPSAAPDQSEHKENETSEQTKTKPIHNDPIHSFYGSKDRQKLFSSEVRNGVGMY